LDQFLPYISGAVLFGISAVIGIVPIRKIIVMREAKHELKHGSAGFLRSTSGWMMIVLWLMATWFVATILGDWASFGDLGRAMDRGMLRLQILLEILAALGSDD
jgi:hypothetical protein